MRARGNIVVLGLPATLALVYVYSYALTYLTSGPERFGIYSNRHDWLYAHVLGGLVALLIGPLQLWLGLNRRTTMVHRVLGGIYVAAVAASGTAAFYLAFHADFGWVFAAGFTSMASAWMISTAFATIAICRRMVEQHREWIIRSYVLTFSFVTFRALETILEIAKAGTIIERMTAASWLAWTIPLMITESVLQGRKIFAKAVSIEPAQQKPITSSLEPPNIPLVTARKLGS